MENSIPIKDTGGEKPITEESIFQVLLIKPNDTSMFDFNNVNYITDLMNLDSLQVIETSSDDIGRVLVENLNPSNLDNTIAVTNICYESKEALYEICFLDLPKDKKTKNNYNDLATILDISKEKIYGNAIILKTHLPEDNYSMKLIDSNKNTIKTILESRVNHKGVFINDEGEMTEMVFRDIKPKLKELFDDYEHVTKFETAFLKHNFTMYYDKNSLENQNNLVTKIAENKINGDVFITSMVTKELFTDITKEEVNKILKISNFDQSHWKASEKDDEHEKDSLDRNIIKSKYRILHQKYQNLCNVNLD